MTYMHFCLSAVRIAHLTGESPEALEVRLHKLTELGKGQSWDSDPHRMTL